MICHISQICQHKLFSSFSQRIVPSLTLSHSCSQPMLRLSIFFKYCGIISFFYCLSWYNVSVRGITLRIRSVIKYPVKCIDPMVLRIIIIRMGRRFVGRKHPYLIVSLHGWLDIHFCMVKKKQITICDVSFIERNFAILKFTIIHYMGLLLR